MTGIIDVGGGERGVYGAGVFDRCLDDGVTFDCIIGVSAGSANGVTFAAGQRSRTFSFYYDYSFRREYMSLSNYVKNKSFVDLDYIYSDLSNSGGENPLDFEAIKKYNGIINITATDAQSGNPVYFSVEDMKQDDYSVVKASCSVPIACKPVNVNGKYYFDGGVADPVPINRAIELGCDKIVVILTKPVDYRKSGVLEKNAGLAMRALYGNVADRLECRGLMYNTAVRKAVRMQEQGRCLVVSPDDCCKVTTFRKTKKGIKELYEKGYKDAGEIADFIGS